MSSKVFIAIIVGIVVTLLGVVIFIGDTGDGPEADPSEKTDGFAGGSRNIYGISPKGIILEEAYSLGCPTCAEYHQVLKPLREEFKDRVIFRPVHYPLISSFPNALAAHRAVEAAARQGKFWQMHDLLFEKRDLWIYSTTNNPVPQFEQFASELGLDIEQFKTDFSSTQVNKAIQDDTAYLDDLGVAETPRFIFQGELLTRADHHSKFGSLEVARNTLNEALAAAKDKETDEQTKDPNYEAQRQDISSLRQRLTAYLTNNTEPVLLPDAIFPKPLEEGQGKRWKYYTGGGWRHTTPFADPDAQPDAPLNEYFIWTVPEKSILDKWKEPNIDVFYVLWRAACQSADPGVGLTSTNTDYVIVYKPVDGSSASVCVDKNTPQLE